MKHSKKYRCYDKCDNKAIYNRLVEAISVKGFANGYHR